MQRLEAAGQVRPELAASRHRRAANELERLDQLHRDAGIR